MDPIIDIYSEDRTSTARSRYRARQRARGRCRSCAKPAAPGYVRCEHHLAARRAERDRARARSACRREAVRRRAREASEVI